MTPAALPAIALRIFDNKFIVKIFTNFSLFSKVAKFSQKFVKIFTITQLVELIE